MDNFLLYLLKVSVGMVLLYLCYILFFSRDTFYLRNRILLITILLLSIIIPLLSVFNFPTENGRSVTTYSVSSIILSGATLEANVSEKISSINFIRLITWSYFLISGLFLLRAFISVTRTMMIIRQGAELNSKFPRIVLSELDHPPFSFFPFVVIPKKTFESGNCSEMLAHENAHVTQGHTFDLLLSELLIVVLWFNPFIWLIRRSIVLNHEYLADNLTLKSSFSIKEYQYKLLNFSSGMMKIPFAHNFSNSIKNRIIMINKKPTRNYAALKSIIILPVVAILFVMFSCKQESISTKKGYQQTLFAQTSEAEILKFLAMNTGYPQLAKNASDTGRVFVVVKLEKGGIVKECKAVKERSEIKSPFLPEVVIVGYKLTGPDALRPGKTTGNTTGNSLAAMQTECVRVANKLTVNEIPDWKDKNMEFALTFKFILK